MHNKQGLFDINSEKDFFFLINNAFRKYQSTKVKSIELLLFIIMGLNHLREWIAPGYSPYIYDKKNECSKTINPKDDKQRFSKDIYDTAAHNTIRKLCNKSKHFSVRTNTSSLHEGTLDDEPDFDAIVNFDKLSATDFFVDKRNVIEIIDEVINFYQDKWFSKT